MGIHPAIAWEHHDLIAVSFLCILVETHYLSHLMGILLALACEHLHLMLQYYHYHSLLGLIIILSPYEDSSFLRCEYHHLVLQCHHYLSWFELIIILSPYEDSPCLRLWTPSLYITMSSLTPCWDFHMLPSLFDVLTPYVNAYYLCLWILLPYIAMSFLSLFIRTHWDKIVLQITFWLMEKEGDWSISSHF